MNAQSLVAKVWNFAHVLRDQGVSYQAYISQVSYLLFLKMDEERVTRSARPSKFAWRISGEGEPQRGSEPQFATRMHQKQRGLVEPAVYSVYPHTLADAAS